VNHSYPYRDNYNIITTFTMGFIRESNVNL